MLKKKFFYKILKILIILFFLFEKSLSLKLRKKIKRRFYFTILQKLVFKFSSKQNEFRNFNLFIKLITNVRNFRNFRNFWFHFQVARIQNTKNDQK